VSSVFLNWFVKIGIVNIALPEPTHAFQKLMLLKFIELKHNLQIKTKRESWWKVKMKWWLWNLVFLDRATSPCSQHLCHGNLDCGTLCYFTVTQRHPIELHPKRLISSPKVPLLWIWRVHASMPLGIIFPRVSHRFTIAKMRYYDMPSCHMFFLQNKLTVQLAATRNQPQKHFYPPAI
jgi:hypothetical protein